MKSSAWLFAAAMSAAGFTLAQTEPQSTVKQTTDPASIAKIERRAQELSSRNQSSSTTTTSTGEQHEGKKHRSARHDKHKAKQKRTMKNKAPSDQPTATEGK